MNCKVYLVLAILNIFVSAVLGELTGILGWCAALASYVYIAMSERQS